MDNKSKDNLKQICQLVVSVYAPGYLRLFFNPSCADGPQTVLHIRDYLISSFLKYTFQASAKNQVKNIFLGHTITWLDAENVALSVYSDNNLVNKESLARITRVLTPEERKRMLRTKSYKLSSFYLAESGSAPCVLTSEILQP